MRAFTPERGENMRFTKMEGLGNDYIYVNCMEGEPEDLPTLAVRLSDRHFGVGADGLICIKPGRTGDFTMEMYNADGSRGAMCGNGIRCVGKYVYDRKLTRKTCLTIDTDAGPRGLELAVRGGKVEQVTVDMGQAILYPEVELEAMGEQYTVHQEWGTLTPSFSAQTQRGSGWKNWARCWNVIPICGSGPMWNLCPVRMGMISTCGCGNEGAGSP